MIGGVPHTHDGNGKPTSWIITVDGLAEIGRYKVGWTSRDDAWRDCLAPVKATP